MPSGLRGIGQTNELPDRPEIRGMIARVPHLVDVVEEVATVKLHDLAPPAGATTARRRVGRGIGGKGGKTAGRGTKGQKARNTVPPGFEGGQLPLMQRIPKLKGFKNPFRVEYTPVNLDALDELDDDEITVDTLVEAGLVRPKALVKILGQGSLSRPVRVSAHAFSRRPPPRSRLPAVASSAAAALRPRAPAGRGQRPHQPLVPTPGPH